MTFSEAFDVIEAGQGRWDIHSRGSIMIAGQVWRTDEGFLLLDWLDQRLGSFDTIDDALRFLLHSTNQVSRQRGAA
jgi:hypothetical protein